MTGTEVDVVWTIPRTELGSDFSGNGLTLEWFSAKTVDLYTFLTGLSVQSVLSSDALLQNSSALGGFLNLSGYAVDELAGQHTGALPVLLLPARQHRPGGVSYAPLRRVIAGGRERLGRPERHLRPDADLRGESSGRCGDLTEADPPFWPIWKRCRGEIQGKEDSPVGLKSQSPAGVLCIDTVVTS